jgi:FtsP/CotA-like multicopper oxidase with cupredoxin domain
MDRRDFLAAMGTPACWSVASRLAAQAAPENPKADITLRISPVEIEIAPRRTIKTTGYNGSVPGPVLRLREGQSVTVEVHNETPTPEIVHWHGLFIPSEVDGAAEEGTPLVPAHSSRRYAFVPRPSGTRWYHTHVSAGQNLKCSTYTGQFGFLYVEYVEPNSEPGQYDAEVFLALHGWDPYLGTMGADEGTLDVIYRSFSVNNWRSPATSSK